MLLGAFVLLRPGAGGLIVAETFLRTGFPIYIALLWFIVFPVSVAYGIVKKELFDIRHLARSSVAYGAATLAITGSLRARRGRGRRRAASSCTGTHARPRFTLVFLFFAILAVNPLRRSLAGRSSIALFDREQGRYRQTVREISEAMVSMLSIQEIVERIVRALSDAMGVERSMVLLISDDEHALLPAASRRRLASREGEIGLPTDHPVCKYLWMRREEVSRGDLDDEADAQDPRGRLRRTLRAARRRAAGAGPLRRRPARRDRGRTQGVRRALRRPTTASCC